MLLFTDSFDDYATADILTKWTTGTLAKFSTSVVTIGAFGRNGTNGMRFFWDAVNAELFVQIAPSPSDSTAIVGVALNPSAISSSLNPLFVVYNGATAQTSLRINADGTVSVLRGNFASGTVLGASTAPIAAGSFNYIEFKVGLHTSTGSYTVRLNGVSILSGSGVNTAGAGNTVWSALRIGSDALVNHLSGGITWGLDDLYLCDGSGSRNNDFLGPIRVIAQFPTGDGNHTGFTPSTGVNHYATVDEAAPNGDTDYNSATVAGTQDTYTFPALGLTGSILGVQTGMHVRSAGGGAEIIRRLHRISGTTHTGTSMGVSTSYLKKRQVDEVSPATSNPFTVSELNGMETGIELVS